MLPATTRSELGTLSGSFRTMVDYQQETAHVAESVAAGDLTCTVTATRRDRWACATPWPK